MEYIPNIKSKLEAIGYKVTSAWETGTQKVQFLAKKDIRIILDDCEQSVVISFYEYPVHGIESESHLLEFEEKVYGEIEMPAQQADEYERKDRQG